MNCSLCGNSAFDNLVYGYTKKKVLFWEIEWGKKMKPFCRQHLIQEFKKYFLNFPKKIVVFYPELEHKKGSYVYGNMSLDEMKKRKVSLKTLELIEKSLKEIKGDCMKCKKPASIAYFGQGVLQWGGGMWDYPLLEKITTEPQILCKECSFDEIEYSLRSFKDSFAEGLFIPFLTDSILTTFPI